MTLKEFSDNFDILLNSYSQNSEFGKSSSSEDIVLDEYEKSVLLTKAQEEFVISYYAGRTSTYDSFESTEENARYLDSLVKTHSYNISDKVEGLKGLTNSSVFFKLPSDIAFITLEQVYYSKGTSCYGETVANVYSVTQDEWATVKDNPFRGPTKYKALRLNYGTSIVEIISKFPIEKYIIKYLAKPEPIILIDLPDGLTIQGGSNKTECKLNPILHNLVLQRAVELAIASRSMKRAN